MNLLRISLPKYPQIFNCLDIGYIGSIIGLVIEMYEKCQKPLHSVCYKN